MSVESATTSSLDIVAKLSCREILRIVGRTISIPRDVRERKDRLVEHVLYHAPSQQRAQLLEEGTKKMRGQKRRRAEYEDDSQTHRNVRRRRLIQEVPIRDTNRFLELPPDSKVKSCHRNFISATSNHALQHLVCFCCARQRDRVLGRDNERWRLLKLKNVPNVRRLRPATPHPAQELVDGLLVEQNVMSHDRDGDLSGHLCDQCYDELRNDKGGDLPPKFSLANDMWIGPIPQELKRLSFAEQQLIALVYPRVFVFKLFPKKAGIRKVEQLQRAMRGNVTSFELDQSSILDMLHGNLMPRPPAILSSVITITYSGLCELPKSWIYNTFRVRRSIIGTALGWLKRNNTKYYGNIVISEDRLQALPDNDVPDDIMEILRCIDDDRVGMQEEGGYVPLENVQDEVEGDDFVGDDHSPDVIPLQFHGAVDSDLTRMPSSELARWSLANTWKKGEEGAYVVRHGNRLVSDFGRPLQGNAASEAVDRSAATGHNYFEKAFPILFPYGRGGLESNRPVLVDFKDHVRWALRYHDQRFRRHEKFPFVAFSILQRREALASARVQMQRKTFDRDCAILGSITPERLQQAERQEASKEPITDPAIQLLRRHMQSVSGRVSGSNASRTKLRSQIWSTITCKGPPTLWVTINPCDLHDPVAQVMCGEEIDLDSFCGFIGPDKDKRAQNIAADPYAAAEYFHYMVKTIIKTLFGVQSWRESYIYDRVDGIFGRVAAFFGVVECQGRGSLHLHLLLWLEDAPTHEEMHELLKLEEFRRRIIAFIEARIHASYPGLDSEEDIQMIAGEKDVAYSRPPNPDSPRYAEEVAEFEKRVVREKQIHECEPRRCLVMDRRGRISCKRRAPWELAEVAFVREDGSWGPRRLYGFFNNYVPSISICTRANNDIKLLTNGGDTKNITFYVTKYIAKAQQRSHNLSAITSGTFAYHQARTSETTSRRERQRMLLFRLANAINREQELAGPMVISYLMGWGDTFCSHRYATIYWSAFVYNLCEKYPYLGALRSESINDAVEITNTSGDEDNDKAEEVVELEVDNNGSLCAKSQFTDYMYRGEGLDHMNVIDFFVNTWEERVKSRQPFDSDQVNGDRSCDGRRHERHPYIGQHPSKGKVYRVLKSPGHNTLPNFVGARFPRQDVDETHEFYCASMLMLLKPWRNIEIDLKNANESWQDAMTAFVDQAPQNTRDVIVNIQYYYECQRAAAEKGREDEPEVVVDEEEDIVDNEDASDPILASGLTAQRMEQLERTFMGSNEREDIHGRTAVLCARAAGLLDCDQPRTQSLPPLRLASDQDRRNYSHWRELLDDDANQQALVSAGQGQLQEQHSGRVDPMLRPGQRDPEVEYIMATDVSSFETGLDELRLEELNEEQRRAYDIVAWHLQQHLQNAPDLPPLRLAIHGQGGTGKSRVIQTITKLFELRGVPFMLQKAAYTGIAASLIEGKTLHEIALIPVSGNQQVSNKKKEKLEAFWREKAYLIIDEHSMLSKTFLARLSRNIGIGKQEESSSSLSFGGVNVVICGDFHQFPPVATAAQEALYFSIDFTNDTADRQLGRKIYEEFNTVVVLKRQMRVVDHEWKDFLDRLRNGIVNKDDIAMLQGLVLDPEKRDHEFLAKNPILITPRHGVRDRWNEAALQQHCLKTGNRRFVCRAEDSVKGQPLNLRERYALFKRESAGGSQAKRILSRTIELAIGAKVMVTQNLDTDLDITNRARAEIVDIVLNSNDDVEREEDGVVYLKRLPLYILVKMDRTRARKLPGLDEGVIPISPISQSLRITVPQAGSRKLVSKTVKRHQFPMTLAYAFTDYRAQGQTIEAVVVDVARPPTGKLTLFNLYVALSRSRGRDSIRLLRHFDERDFMETHSPDLMEEDDRIRRLDQQTAAWWRIVAEKER